MKFQKHFFFVFLAIFCGHFLSFGQAPTRDQLEQRRMELKQEIVKINALLIDTKQKEKSILSTVADLEKRIETTENLIGVIDKESDLLSREIDKNQKKIEQLLAELETLKKDYANMVVRSRRSSSRQNRLMFLFASESFLQAYKRLQYMRQYADYRKEQGLRIKDQTALLEVMNKNLLEQKKEKEKLLVDKQIIRKKLLEDKEEQQALIASILDQEDKFAAQINKKQQQIDKIDQQIDALIRAAIAEENKKKGSSERDVFELTPKAKALAADFKDNKGKLPWPVESGIVAMTFGQHPHPIVSSVTVSSNGVRINTEENALAKSIFGGVVSEVQSVRGAHMAVMVRHGNYISIYNNLSNVFVEKGDQVHVGEALGQVAKSTATGKTTLYFLIYKNTQKLDPADWIYKM